MSYSISIEMCRFYFRILRILHMYDVLRTHITNMVYAISLQTNRRFSFSNFDGLSISTDIRSNDLVNDEQVAMVLASQVSITYNV